MELHEINVEVLDLFDQSKKIIIKNDEGLAKAKEYLSKAEKLKKALAENTYEGVKKTKADKVKNILNATHNFLDEKITKFESIAAAQKAKQEVLEQKRAENTAKIMDNKVEQFKEKENAVQAEVKEEKQEEVEAKKKPGKSRK